MRYTNLDNDRNKYCVAIAHALLPSAELRLTRRDAKSDLFLQPETACINSYSISKSLLAEAVNWPKQWIGRYTCTNDNDLHITPGISNQCSSTQNVNRVSTAKIAERAAAHPAYTHEFTSTTHKRSPEQLYTDYLVTVSGCLKLQRTTSPSPSSPSFFFIHTMM